MLWVGLLLMMVLGGCAAKEERFEFTRLEMGVRARVVMYARSKEAAEAGAKAAFARIAELDACMSDYRPDSEVMRPVPRPVGQAVPISAELFEVLATAQRVSEASGGAFDVTVGPVVVLWRQARKEQNFPRAMRRLGAAMEAVGWRNVS